MRKTVVVLVLLSIVALPAAAQLRVGVPAENPSARLYETPGSGLFSQVLNKLFNPSVFSMSHGIEMSTGSFGGQGYSTGMYTNTMKWEFSEKFAMRADVAVAYSPQNRASTALGLDQGRPRVFLRNAEITWKPSKKWHLNIQVRQDPYGYRNPYGYGPFGYGYGYSHRRAYSPFWFDRW